jgi:hypothetical protein
MSGWQNELDSRPIRVGEILAADPDGLKVLVLIASDGPCVITYQGVPLRPALPDPCSRRVRRRVAHDMPLQPGDVLVDNKSGLVVRCIRGGSGDVCCNGRPLLLDRQSSASSASTPSRTGCF